MKLSSSKFFSYSAALLLSVSMLPTSASAQTATTDPVGFITLNVYGGSPASPKQSLVSPTLTQPILWQGAVTAVGATGTQGTITVSGTPWSSNQFNGAAGSHYVEVVSTANPAISGTLADITATAPSVITTAQITGAAVGDTVKIRKDVTISDLFGANNTAGLQGSAVDVTSADEVLIYNGASFVTYFYYNGSDVPQGWYNANSGAPSGGVSIAPSEAVVIKRKSASALAVVFTGAVKTGNTLIPIQNGLNVLGTASAKGLTLDTSGLYTGNNLTGVKPSAVDVTTADEIILYTATSQVTYFYYNGTDAPQGWYNANNGNPSGAVPIAPGTAFVLKRKGGNAFNWVLPSPTSF